MPTPLEKVRARRQALALQEKKDREYEKRDKLKEIPHDIIFDELDCQRGNIDETAKALGITYPQLTAYIDRHQDLTQLLILSRERLVDKAEKVLESHLDNNSLRASMFALKTIGKERGYYEKKEITDDTPAGASAKMKIDLSKLSGQQLLDLKDIMTAANQPDDMKTIEGTAEDVTLETE